MNEHQSTAFLVASIAFITAGTGLSTVLTAVPGVGIQIISVLHYVVSFVAPAAGVVALKTLYEVGRSA